MIYGAVLQSPVHGGRLASYDFNAIRKMPGVLGVVVIDPDAPRKRLKTPANDGESLAQSAVVMVAEHYWQARQAIEGIAGEVERRHWRTLEGHRACESRRNRLTMRVAAAAAPKPLSIFTTVTPGAHEFSIVNSAARPPRLAP